MGRKVLFYAVVVVVSGCSAAPDDLMLAALDKQAARQAEAAMASQDLAAAPLPARPAPFQEAAGEEVLSGELAPVRTDSPQGGSFWLAMAPPPALTPAPAAQDSADGNRAGSASTQPAAATTQPADGMTYVPWQHRQGPAYPGNFWYSFGRWGKEMPETLWDDTKATFTNPWTWVGLGAAGAAGITLNTSRVDAKVANFYTKHGSQLSDFWDSVGDAGGNPGTHFAVAGVMYFGFLAADDKVNYEKTTTLFNALIINDLTVVGLKVATRTRSPNGDDLAWPSGHAASSFTFATVMWEEYGPWAGAPLMAFAGFVGYERIDARNHQFSDVISGALIGMAIGHAVAQNHMPRVMGFDVVPYVSPDTGAVGVAATKRW